jgi:lysophospholipase L1-like esterase
MTAPAAGARGGRRARRLLANLALAVASLGLALGACEALLRILGYRPIYETYSRPTLFWAHDPVLGWSHPPGARGEYVGPRPWPIEFQTPIEINAEGLRGPELEPLPAGGRRVLFLGDSMVAAFEVPYEQTFTALLEPILSERLGAEVQVLNAGVRGYGTDQSYLYYRARARAFRPDLVVLFHSGNDLEDNEKLHEMRRPLGKAAFALEPDGSLALHGQPVPAYAACSEYRISPPGGVRRVDGRVERAACALQMALFDHSALFSFLTMLVPWDENLLLLLYRFGGPAPKARAQAVQVEPPDQRYRRELALALLERLAREVEADGSRVLVTGIAKHLRALGVDELRARGVAVQDLSALDGEDALRLRWKHDAHYNAEGHRRVAEVLAPAIEAQLRAGRAGEALRTGSR